MDLQEKPHSKQEKTFNIFDCLKSEEILKTEDEQNQQLKSKCSISGQQMDRQYNQFKKVVFNNQLVKYQLQLKQKELAQLTNTKIQNQKLIKKTNNKLYENSTKLKYITEKYQAIIKRLKKSQNINTQLNYDLNRANFSIKCMQVHLQIIEKDNQALKRDFIEKQRTIENLKRELIEKQTTIENLVSQVSFQQKRLKNKTMLLQKIKFFHQKQGQILKQTLQQMLRSNYKRYSRQQLQDSISDLFQEMNLKSNWVEYLKEHAKTHKMVIDRLDQLFIQKDMYQLLERQKQEIQRKYIGLRNEFIKSQSSSMRSDY